ncbi:uncharacterized protein LOC115923809 [Strongylocentrotus purpuratus]|uniref:PHD-type domain-containing protein n=1 Tax=Strongylocentrotus purpuratus TaxID=7668 RepID=A0A7M7NSU2_STRPU|nr:uncharacterized protein LOC115923809 [Strongylocentrotus purpuratus]
MCAGDVQPNPGPARPSNRKKSSAKACSSCSKLVIGKNKLTCSDCQLLFHPSCVGVKQKQLSNLRANSAQWYCSDCCAPCSMCDGNVLRDHHAVQCDSCDKWLHTACCDIDYQLYTSLMANNCTWVCPLCSELNFSDSFFSEGEISTENPFDALDTDADADVCSQPASQKDVGASQPKPNSNRNKRHNKENRKCNAKKRDKVKLILTNCQSVRSKAGDIEVLIDSVKPDFICGTESWLDPDVNSSEIFPDYHSIFRKDREQLKTGGGVFQAVKGDLITTHCSELNSDCEILWTETKIKGCRPLLVGVFYRPPNDSNGEAIDHLAQSFTRLGNKINSHNVILTGDFNLPNISWDDHVVSSRSGYSTRAADTLVTLVEELGLTQHVTQPTRIQGNTENILDLIFSNNPEIVDKISVTDGIADHSSVIVDLRVAPTRKRPIRRKIYLRGKADTQGIKETLQDFTDTYFQTNQDKSVEDKWEEIRSAILHTMEKHVPHKFSTTRFNLPWFNRSLHLTIKKKQRLYNKAVRAGKPDDWESFKAFRKSTHKLIKEARSLYVRDTLESAILEEPKRFWSYIKQLKQENSGVADLQQGEKTVSNDIDKANVLNEQFRSVFTNEPPGLAQSLGNSPYQKIGHLNITRKRVEKLLSTLKTNKAQGPDGIPPWFLKIGAEQLSAPLQDLFQSSINTGIVPQEWRDANVAAIFKKGSRKSAANYRPVSLTSVLRYSDRPTMVLVVH